MISTYVKLLSVTSRMLENRIILVFDGVMTYFELFVNGQRQVSTRAATQKACLTLPVYARKAQTG